MKISIGLASAMPHWSNWSAVNAWQMCCLLRVTKQVKAVASLKSLKHHESLVLSTNGWTQWGYADIHFPNLVDSTRVYNRPILQISWISTHDFFELPCQQTNIQKGVKTEPSQKVTEIKKSGKQCTKGIIKHNGIHPDNDFSATVTAKLCEAT